ncbi:MAG: hypothetical protein JJU02_11820, partial [Cryomorphaceae bacterium]|nr:hypothetical protein [Cryomorphaceae bacterium]
MRNFILLLFVLACANIAGQNEPSKEICGTDEIHKHLMATDSAYARGIIMQEEHIFNFVQDSNNVAAARNAFYTIPVVVHVVHLGEPVGTGSNISNAQINQAINGLNDRFANLMGNTANGNNMNIQFCLASRDPNGNPTSGINRVNGSSVPNYSSGGIGQSFLCATGSGANEAAVKSLSTWPSSDYYNIWVVSDICNGNGLGGYAYFPSGNNNPLDGTVVRVDQVSYSNHLLAHEIGHGLFLYHTFEGSTSTLCPPNSNCLTQGDKCCDTPPHRSIDCGSSNPCATSFNWVNSSDNIMSYCWNFPLLNHGLFTLDQRSRMLATLVPGGLRHSLTLSNGCNLNPQPPSNPCNNISSIACGSNVSFSLSGTGSWNSITDNDCGYISPGTERIYSFTPNVTGTYSLNVTSVSNNSYVDYLWKSGSCSPNGWNCLADLNSTGTYSVNATWQAGVTYYILVDPEVTSSVSHTFNISCLCINPPQPGTIIGPSSICSGQAYSYSIPQASGALSQVWSYSGSGTISGSGNSISLNASSSGTLSVYHVDGNNCSSTPRTMSIFVNPTPNAPNSINGPSLICSGQSGSFSVNSVANANQYRWFYNSSQVGLTSSPSFSFTPSSNGSLTVVAENGNCTSNPSPAKSITVSIPPPTPSSIAGPNNVCEGDSATFSVNSVSGASQYEWRFSGVTINTTSSPSISFPISQNGAVSVRAINSNGCASTFSSKNVNVWNPVQVSLSRSNSDTVCSNQTGPVLTSTLQNSGSGSLSYSWEKFDASTNSWMLQQTGGLSFNTGVLSETSTFRLRILDNSCGNDYVSNQVQVVVYDTLVAGDLQLGSSQQICNGETPSSISYSSPSGGSNNFSYQWEVSVDGISWSNIPGQTTLSFSPGNLFQTTYYRLRQMDNHCSPVQTVFTDSVIVVVYDTLVRGNNISGANQQICYGETPSPISFSSPGGGSNNFSYQWEVSVDGTSWSNIPGQTTLSFSPGNLFETTYYRLRQMDNHCSPAQTVFTDSAIVVVYDTLVRGNNISGTNQQICYGETPSPISFSSPGGGSNNFSYQWEVSVDGTSWSNIPGQTTLSLTPGNLFETTYYRLHQIDNHCSPAQTVFTDSVVVFVYDAFVRGNIISGTNQQICNGETPSSIGYSSPSGGSNNFSYQWEVSVDGTSWSNISGQTTLSFSPGNLFQTTYYRLRQMDNHCSPVQTVFADSVIVVVYDTLVRGNNISADNQQICYGETPSPKSFSSPGGGSNNFSYQWEVSVDGTSWS